jgi:(p)ppGpp synthase/HD superfamily hydrolase
MKYYKLTDKLNCGDIVRSEDGEFSIYTVGPNQWIPTGIMVGYFWPDDVFYEQYTIISEKKALELIEERKTFYNDLLKKAEEIAKKAHAGQVDKGGNPYINHPKAIADSLTKTEEKIVAYLHDVLEDSNYTAVQLKSDGFTLRIIRSVEILTKDKNTAYNDYLVAVKRNANAWSVKKADLKHNMDISRIPNPTQKDLDRIKKYKEALHFLES